MHITRPAVFALTFLILGLAPAGAQTRLDAPSATFDESFALIQTVREMADGRVLVADPLGKVLALIDLERGSMETVGAEGQGPDEYLQPDAVWPLPGDSTLLVDLGNARLTAIGPDLAFGPTSRIQMGDPAPGRELVLAMPGGVDARGRIYTRGVGVMGARGPMSDSVPILRIDRATRETERIALVKREDRTTQTSGDANNQRVAVTPVPLSPEDAWGVAPDGRVVVARSRDYVVEWFAPDGTVTRGDPVPFDPVPIRRAEKEEWRAAQTRSGGGIGISLSVNDGAVTMSFARGAGPDDSDELDRYEWPETKPPVYQGRVRIDPRGRAWVRRHVAAGERPTYDLFGPDGNRVQTVLLPQDRTLVGFGASSLYAVRHDEFDLGYLERYDLPDS